MDSARLGLGGIGVAVARSGSGTLQSLPLNLLAPILAYLNESPQGDIAGIIKR